MAKGTQGISAALLAKSSQSLVKLGGKVAHINFDLEQDLGAAFLQVFAAAFFIQFIPGEQEEALGASKILGQVYQPGIHIGFLYHLRRVRDRLDFELEVV